MQKNEVYHFAYDNDEVYHFAHDNDNDDDDGDDEVYHPTHDDAKKNPQQLSLVKPEEAHHLLNIVFVNRETAMLSCHLSKYGNCHQIDPLASTSFRLCYHDDDTTKMMSL